MLSYLEPFDIEIGQTVYALQKSWSNDNNRGGIWGKVLRHTNGRVYLACPDGRIRYVRDYEHEFLLDTTAVDDASNKAFGQGGE